MELVEQMLKGEIVSLSRVISLVENESKELPEIMRLINSHVGKAYCIGITGPPGAGKSTLVDKLTTMIRKESLTVGIIAADPSSPFTGGAVLGDRIRMQQHYLDEGVFIRSMASRGSLGGLPQNTGSVVKVFDAFGKDIVLVETVGVGQSEIDIMKNSDTVVVILSPEAGDSVQTMKAGLFEIADIFVVNKADHPEADNPAIREARKAVSADNNISNKTIKAIPNIPPKPPTISDPLDSSWDTKEDLDRGFREMEERCLKKIPHVG